MKILLIEDNLTITKGLEYALANESFTCFIKTSLKDAKTFLAKEIVDLIILDITLPDGDGFTFYENELKEQNIPVIFLTARDEEDDIVKGLELGASDYLTKPFSTKELIARINKILMWKKNNIIKIKDISFDLDKMEVKKNNEVIDLTSLELKLLQILFLNHHKVVTRSTILDKIWEWTGNDVDDHTITVYLKRIRNKLDSDIIKTIKGIGYRIDDEK